MSTTDSAEPSITERFTEMMYKADPSVKVDFGNISQKEGNGGNKTVGPGRLRQSILRSDALVKYILETSVYPREHKALQGLRKNTEKNHARSKLATNPDEGQFLGLLLKLMNAKKTIELGVFTGYSLLCTALALPEDGKVIALDINRDAYNMGVPFIEEAGVAHKIDFREGLAMDSLKVLLSEDNYINYHPLLLKLVRLGGLIAYDNTLWGGSVADDDEESWPDFFVYFKKFILELNTFLAADPRVEISHLSIGDGVTLCRRIV